MSLLSLIGPAGEPFGEPLRTVLLDLYTIINGGNYITLAPPAGESNNVSTGLVLPQYASRVDVDLSAGSALFSGFAAGVDNQTLFVSVSAPLNTGNTLTLEVLSASSDVANQFRGKSDVVLGYLDAAVLRYYGKPVNNWVIVSRN